MKTKGVKIKIWRLKKVSLFIKSGWGQVLLGISLVILALIFNILWVRKSADQLTINQKPFYLFKNISNQLKPPVLQKKYQINIPQFNFLTQIPKQTSKINISFYYLCEPECENLRLDLLTSQKDIPLSFYLSNEKLANLDYFYVEDQGLMFYQKKPSYKTVDQFLQNQKEPLLTEQSIAFYKGLDNYPQIELLENVKKAKIFDYILSTYIKPRSFWGWSKFDRSLDVSGAERDEAGNLKWQLIYEGENEPEIWITEPVVGYFEN